MKWLEVKLSDIAVINMGQSPPGNSYNEDGKGIPLFQGKAEFGDMHPTPVKWCSEPTRIAESGDILMSVRAPVGPTNIADQLCCIGRGLCAIRANKKLAVQKYLYFLFKYIEPSISRQGQGSTFQSINRSTLESINIPLPPVYEQSRIVKILDQADTLRRMRAEADVKGDRILPALFIKMFGDPAKNPMGWDIVLVEKLFSRERAGTKCGPFGSALKKHEYVDKGIPVWGIDNIKPNQFVESGSLFITPIKYEELKSYSVEPGDIIISRAGTVGRMCVARPQQSHSIISTNLIRLTLDKKGIFPEYFTSLLSYFPTSVNQLRASGDDGAYSFMNTTILKSLKIPLPPFDLQNEYTRRMAEIRRLNEKQIESQAKLNNIFQCLLYRAFSGELTAKWREAHIKELLVEMEEQAKLLKLETESNYKQLTL
ncbi:MAG: restriction endonuclease subunit S [Nostoc sp.]|uniref:restriction endonuclease subunit S n=1 Tax=Nostoc sp. TaxID=1180 RepID=UPI002FFA9221